MSSSSKRKTKVKKPQKAAPGSTSRKAPRPPKTTAYTVGGTKGKGNPFKVGNPGKPKGRLVTMKYRVKEALLEAADASGCDGKGTGGMVGYFVWLSRAEPAVFGRMLEKVMPTQVELNDRRTQLTPAEAADRLRARGIPVPPLLLEMTSTPGAPVIENEPVLTVVNDDPTEPPLDPNRDTSDWDEDEDEVPDDGDDDDEEDE